MTDFFDHPILNSPYEYPEQPLGAGRDRPAHQPASKSGAGRVHHPHPQAQEAQEAGEQIVFDEGKGLSTAEQQYDPTPVINELRQRVDRWRMIPNPSQWRVTPETARLLQHWRHHDFGDIRPFFCQVEAVETAIWLTEVAPELGKEGRHFLDHLTNANEQANPGLPRLALKLATGAGKTTVMAMLIAWQTINAVRHPGSKRFTRGSWSWPPDSPSRTASGCYSQTTQTPTTRAGNSCPTTCSRCNPRQDRDHQLPRLPAPRAHRDLQGRPPASDRAHRRGTSDHRDRGPDDPAGHARPHGHEEHHGPQR